MERLYGLDQPLWSQYIDYISHLFKGHWGQSYTHLEQPVFDILMEAFSLSIQMGFIALFLAFLVGIPLGLLAASKHKSIWDFLIMFSTISGFSLPCFLTAPVLILILSFHLKFFLKPFSPMPPHIFYPVLFYLLAH